MNTLIKQLFIPQQFQHYKRQSLIDERLGPYNDPDKPAFFFSTRSIEKIMTTHKGPAVLIVNNDIRPVENNLEWVKNRKNLYFISTSKLMSTYLDGLGIKYIEFPFSIAKISNVNVKPKGKSIYVYGDGPNSNFYGYHIIKRLIKNNFPSLNIIYAKYGQSMPPFINYTREELDKVFDNVFLGIRLINFDGLSATVVDLGMRGIKTIWNGGTPSALSYSSERDIINHIKNEYKKVGTSDHLLSQTVFNFLNPLNSKYDYIYDLSTYSNDLFTPPKLFLNNESLTFHPYNKWIKERRDMNKPLSI
mgnify:CR=1 FL=1|jgi:hypothetical protein|tara:strand:+ start:2328 stop:3239 length:912 start_codon:yes stop_codon:yes gene_type:complete